MKMAAWLVLHNPWRVRTWLMYYRTLYPSHKPDDFDNYMRALKDNLSEPGRFAAAAALAECSRAPAEERLERVAVPTLVIMGTKDRDFPDPVAEGRFIEERTGGTLKLVDGAGHYPQTEMPDTATPLILDFLGGPSAGA